MREVSECKKGRKHYWLIKSEPSTYSIDQLSKDKTTSWDCVRNYEARNNLKSMKVGDLLFFYHSSTELPGIVGLAEVSKEAYPDETQFDSNGEYFDPKATRDKPRWFSPQIKFRGKFAKPLLIGELRANKKLKNMVLLKRGSRLSVQPIDESEAKLILTLIDK